MPNYEYECKRCQHHFVELQSFSDKVKRKCPKCGKLALKRLLGAGAAIIFRGRGFYTTDSKGKP